MVLYPPDKKRGMSAEVHIWNVPFLCSCTALVLSFLGIILLLSGHVHTSFSLILIAVLFDMLDGALSRRLGQETSFGALFDLLQDAINYLLYPSILSFMGGFNHWTAVILLCFFIGCGTFRLARFGTMGFVKRQSGLSYVGMPVYFNHLGVLVFLLLQQANFHIEFAYIWLPMNSALMVSSLKFPKPKNMLLWGTVLIGVSIFFFWS